jgi:hypothetical protein
VLSNWLDNYARQADIDSARLRRMVAFELLLLALDEANDQPAPQFVIKGGVALELRLDLGGRATKDIDAMLRTPATEDEIEAFVRESLANRRVADATSFEVRGGTPIGPTGAVQFDVRVFWNAASLARVKLEVSPAEGESADSWDDVPTLDIARNFGIAGVPDFVPCLPVRFQIAQKLHAVSSEYEGNDRFRDLIDLLLLDDLSERDHDGVLCGTCCEVFEDRAVHSWPPTIPVRAAWREGYGAAAADLSFPVVGLEDAVAAVNAMIKRIDAAR